MVGFSCTNYIVQTDSKLDSLQRSIIQQRLKSLGISKDIPEHSTASIIVEWLIKTFGGLITTIIMYFLHRWLPDIFPYARRKKYKPPASKYTNKILPVNESRDVGS
jgi:hypothetical protein